ncbi:Rib/alpha-like domain-containing protein [Arcanobacterium buesumense]|uniref:LPXTG cell wall anchor domain-containing protein n=1 Tax=Arcanobacterium buesumense TaxID=2722751 RepID=A0A6H2EMS1_9ACTO|nr:Rib/alpha-like domain-containing protein [Arcanobacterium buesumense]QJC22378.1 LPXTG cell wall anchor domain-containing protein [Arcanobacterium buesumense]
MFFHHKLRKFCATLSLTALLTMGAITTSMAQAAPAVETDQTPSNLADQYTFHFDWDSKNFVTFDPSMKGQEETLLAQFHLIGTDPNTNERTLFHPAILLETKLGESQTYSIPTASYEWGGTTYTDIRLSGDWNCADLYPGYPVGENQHTTRIVSASSACPLGRENGPDPAQGTDTIRFALEQNANTDVSFKIADDSTVFSEHRDNLKVKFGLNKTYNGATEVHTNKNGKPVTAVIPFADGQTVYLANVTPGTNPNDNDFNRALSSNHLDMFSQYTGKYQSFTLTAEFADSSAPADKLAQYYDLTVDGSDIEGWTLTLHSKELQAHYSQVSALPDSQVDFVAPTVDVVPTEDVEQFAVPDKMTFAENDKTPQWVTVNPDGSLSGKLPQGAKPGSTIDIPVSVTLPDGKVTETIAQVKVDQPLVEIAPIGTLTVTGEATFTEGKADEATLEITTEDDQATVSATDVPQGLTFDPATGKLSGTPVVQDWADEETSRVVPVSFTVKNSDGSTFTTTLNATINRDSDSDGVADTADKCADTPADAHVDGNGCAVAPQLPSVPTVAGEKGKEITPVEIPVSNPGKFAFTCAVTDLPAGLHVKLNDAGTACVIYGTPSADTVKDAQFTIQLAYTHPDGEKTAGKSPVYTGNVDITLPAMIVDPTTTIERPSSPLIPLTPAEPIQKPGTPLIPLTPAEPIQKPGTPLIPLTPAEPIQKPGKMLAKTGAQTLGLVALAGLTASAGALLVAQRRKES